MPCVSPEVIPWLKAAAHGDEMLERIRAVVAQLDRACVVEMHEATGIPLPSIYAFYTGRTKQPGIVQLNLMLGWLIPGYRVAVTEGVEAPVACDPRVPIDAPKLITRREITLVAPAAMIAPANEAA